MNIMKLMGALSNPAKLQEEMAANAKKLASETFVGIAGGEMVTVVVNGAMQVCECKIDPQLVEDKDRELIEEMVIAATNEALAKARQRSAEFMQQQLRERFDLPGMEGMLKGFMPS